MRQLLAGDGQQLFAHQFADPERLGNVGDHVGGVVERALGKTADNRLEELVDAHARARRHREVLGEVEFAGPFQTANGIWPPQFAWDSMIAMSFLFDAIKRKGATSEGIRAGLDSIDLDTPLPDLLRTVTDRVERQYIQKALKKARGNVGRCAKICGLSRRSISAKIAEFKLEKSTFKEE